MRYSKNDMVLLCVSLLGLTVALLSGAAEHVPWIQSWCASFCNGCRETAKFTLWRIPLWEWGAGFYVVLVISVLLARRWLGGLIFLSIGVETANEQVAQTAHVSQDMAREIAGINTAVADIHQGGQRVQSESTGLSSLTERLKSLVGQFKT